jgi:glycosyltransferase involved in cell wall biosynthesis/GT2 family glycosyltransferase
VQIALVSAELYPFGGGGIGQFTNAAARCLSALGEVTVLTSSRAEAEHERLRGSGDPRLLPPEIRVAFVAEPPADQRFGFFSAAHFYSALVYDRLRELYPDRPPDLVEFPDFLGEGCVTVQAAATRAPFLRQTLVCVRTHTAGEICETLNGALPRDFPTRATLALERLTLREADRLLWAGGDVLGAYRRFYAGPGVDPPVRLAQASRIRHPFHGPTVEPEQDSSFEPGAPLRLLYFGRFERRKGVANLVAAASGLDRDDFRLTLVGSDTLTAPLRTSMREHVRLAAGDDERIEVRDSVPREELPALIRSHDVVLMPSLWECWPYAALEALHLNRPLVATPVGGLIEMAIPGQSGWLARGTDQAALAGALVEVLDGRPELEAMVRDGGPSRVAVGLTDPRPISDAYGALLAEKPARGRPRKATAAPLVSAIVPYHAMGEFVHDTVASLLAQTYSRIEVIIVNDGSFAQGDLVIAELAARFPVSVLNQHNRGLGAARNFGIDQSRGRYVFPLDADNVAHPGFVERCVEVLEARHEIAYVTSWSLYIGEQGGPVPGDDGFQPLGAGHSCDANAEHNIAGDAAAILRRRVFDLGFRYSEELTSYEDWHLYRELEQAGYLGAVIPERLVNYRVHGESMTRQVAMSYRIRIESEIEAQLREHEVDWAARGA